MSVPTVNINNIELQQHGVVTCTLDNIRVFKESFINCNLRVTSKDDAWGRPQHSAFSLYFSTIDEAKHFFLDLKDTADKAIEELKEGELNPL